MVQFRYPPAPRTPAAAFRRDLELQPVLDASEEEQGGWILVATILDHAARADASRWAPMIKQAGGLAAEVIGETEVERLFAYDPPFVEASRECGVIRLFIERMERAGALHTALATLNALRAVAVLGVVDHGRLAALRARFAWKMGDLEVAKDGYELLEEIAERESEPELLIRAWIGYGSLAHLRGNYPRLQECGERVVMLATTHGFSRLAGLGYHSQMVAAGVRRDFDASIVHGWNEFLAVMGDPIAEGGVILNLGQTLLVAGQHQAAKAAFSRVLEGKPPRVRSLMAIGGLSLASALSGDCALVGVISDELTKQVTAMWFPYQTATALLECATALQIIGDLTGANDFSAKALRLARQHGYHEIELRSESLSEEIARVTAEHHRVLSSEAARVVEQVAKFERSILAVQLTDALIAV